MQVVEQKADAFRQIHNALKEVVSHKKCATCTCFHGDVLAKVQNALKQFNESEPENQLADIEADFERWSKEADPFTAHG